MNYPPSSALRTPRSSGGGFTPGNSQIGFRAPKTRQERQTNFKVVIRVRPPLPRELDGDVPFQNIVAVDDREQSITVSENLDAVMDQDGNVLANPGPYSTHSFVFDYVYDQNCTQKKVYETTARNVVDSALHGYNATIFAYGQTGTGKTFTMEGFSREGGIEARGIIPRAIEQIFGHIQQYASPRMRFLVRASYLQIYNEQISDLLKPERSNLTIREDKKRGIFVENLSEWVVRSPAEIYGLMERGGAIRATGETKMNEMSSRSHAVFIVIAEQSETIYVDEHGDHMSNEEFQRFMNSRGIKREQEMKNLESHLKQSFKVGKLNLVDLAGSERVRLSGATGQRLKESQQINRSLAQLGNVISALIDSKNRQHIPYRDSKLTRMLEDSLGGNCKTTMMAMISPAFEAMQETISTLNFANRAKNIKNEAKINEDLDQKSLLRKYERELKKLRAELEERSKNVVDKRRLLELDEQRRRAEADKMTAIKALEATSIEFMHEKEEKKKLEQRISMLMGQVLRGDKTLNTSDHLSGGTTNGDHSEIHIMMKEQQEKLSLEYQLKLTDLEKERETIEEEKAQVDRYKQLLLKQRDIMIALTQRLVERDEQIMALQDELDAYDTHHRQLEEKLDEKTAMLIKLQRISMEVNATSPYKSEELNKAIGETWAHSENNNRNGAIEVNMNSIGMEEGGSSSGGYSNSSGTVSPSQLRNTIETQRNRIVELEYLLNNSRSNSPLPTSTSNSSTNMNGETINMMKSLKDENARLKALNMELEVRNSRGGIAAADSGSSSELQVRCDTLVKEREAVTTIMEQKIKVLVQNVAQSMSELVSTHPQLGGSGPGLALNKDLHALQRLVGASIAALRNAANASGGSAATASSSSSGSTGSRPVMRTPQSASSSGGGIQQQQQGSSYSAAPMSGQSLRSAPTGSTPLPLPAYPAPATGSNNSNSTANAYSTSSKGFPAGLVASAPRTIIGNQAQHTSASSSGWGQKDEFYSSGDVYRSTDRR